MAREHRTVRYSSTAFAVQHSFESDAGPKVATILTVFSLNDIYIRFQGYLKFLPKIFNNNIMTIF